MRYFLIAGEASGDLHGANLMRALKEKDTEAEFAFWGGDKMARESDGLLVHYKEISLMGFVEVLMSIRRIFRNIARCKEHILNFKPDIVVLIDFPGFNLRMAEFSKLQGIKTVYFIAPKVWAWKENRAHKLEKYVDLLLLILPFEKEYFKKWKVNAHYIGNPLLDEMSGFTPNENFRRKNNLGDQPIIALLPGSRKQEINRILPLMLTINSNQSDYQLVIAGAPGLDKRFYHNFLRNNTSIVFDQTYDLLNHSIAAIVCSGTATLETALFNVPQVCCYAGNPLSFFIAKFLVKVKYISLVNLCLNREAITELLQDNVNKMQLKSELSYILPGGKKCEKLFSDYGQLRTIMGEPGAGTRAADLIVDLSDKS